MGVADRVGNGSQPVPDDPEEVESLETEAVDNGLEVQDLSFQGYAADIALGEPLAPGIVADDRSVTGQRLVPAAVRFELPFKPDVRDRRRCVNKRRPVAHHPVGDAYSSAVSAY